MPLTGLDLLVLVLATGQLVDAWNNASILTPAKARAEAQAIAYHDGLSRYFVSAALSCEYCLSHWAATLLVVTCVGLPGFLAWSGLKEVVMLPVYALAIVRASWLVNSLLPEAARYSRQG